MPVSLRDKVVLVIGASSGVGRAVALEMARDGARVMASARRASRLEDLKTEAEAAGFPIEVFPADAADLAQVEALAEATRERVGSPAVLVYAAGINTADRYLDRLQPPVWMDLIQTNLNGAYYAAQAVLPAMRARRDGHLIFIASISGLAPDASGIAYQASKRGMVGLAHGIRWEEKKNGIRTTVVCPGMIDTELLLQRPVKPTPEDLAISLTPEHVAEAVMACAKLPPRAVIPELTILGSLLQ
jgi:serine 3-dehydrogenase (NADP+)